MNHVALFAGIGGFIYAAEAQGLETVWANEVDNKCCDTLDLNFPNTHISRKSITEINRSDIEMIPDQVDLLTAGFPCQSFSIAGGELKAFDDPRGKLFFDIPRIIGLMESPPKVVLLENVPTLKVFDNGSLLRTVLTEMKFAGYWVKDQHAQILNSAEYGGTPQKRERLFVVCAHKKYFKSNPFDFKKVPKLPQPPLFDFVDRSKMPGENYYLSPENKYFNKISNLADEHGRERVFQIRRVEARACQPNSCPTLTANMGDGGHNVPFVFDEFGLRRLTEDECMRLQGLNPEMIRIPENIFAKDILRMVGNAVSVKTVGAIISEIKSQLLNKPEGDNVRTNSNMAISA